VSTVTTIYVPIRNYPYKKRAGLSEVQLRKRLEKQGWKVWRGGFFHRLHDDLYPVVRRKYIVLVQLIKRLYGLEKLEFLCYMDRVHHGMPDFACYNSTLKEFKFVECKLGHEQLSKRQKLTIGKLQEKGFKVEIHKLVDFCTKTRKARVSLNSREKHILEKDLTLKRF